MKIFISALLLVAAAAHAETVVLEGARLIDGTGGPPIDGAVIVIDGEKIASAGALAKEAYPKGARVVDVHGKTVIPGLINGHGHVGVVLDGKVGPTSYTRENVLRQLVQYQQYGVTSMVALGLNRDLGYELRDEQRKGGLGGASLYVAGRGLGAPDGAPPLPVAADQVYRPPTAEEAVREVKEAAAHKPDLLKIWVDDVFGKFAKMKPEVYRAAIEEAHKDGLRVAAHVFYLEDAKALVAAGVDAFAHSVRDQAIDAATLQAMKDKGTFAIATLNVDESFYLFADEPQMLKDPFLAAALGPKLVAQFSSPEHKKKTDAEPNTAKARAAFAVAQKNLKALRDAGVQVAFGTDSGANAMRVPGFAEHRELELMVKSGLTPMEALVAATRTTAKFLGAADRGTLEAGKRADLVVLSADPLEEITNTRKIAAVWQAGKEVQLKARKGE